jgi:hypothetical protein
MILLFLGTSSTVNEISSKERNATFKHEHATCYELALQLQRRYRHVIWQKVGENLI